MKITCQTEAHHSITFQCAFPTTVTFSSTTTTKPSISGNEHLIHAAFAPGHYSNFTQCSSVVLYSRGSQFIQNHTVLLSCCASLCVCVFMHAKSLQSCLTLCDDAMDCSLPGSSVHGDSPGKNTGVSCHSVLQGTFPAQIEPVSPASHALAGRFFITAPPGKPIISFSLLYSKTLYSVFP